MDDAALEVRLSIPADPRLAAVVRDVVAYGGRQAGRGDDEALSFGRRAEEAFRASAADGRRDARVSMHMITAGGRLEVTMTGEGGARSLAMDL